MVKRGRRSSAIYFCMNPGISVYANVIFLRFFATVPAWPKYILVMVVFPLYMKYRNEKGKDIMIFVVVLETEQSHVVFQVRDKSFRALNK